MALRGPLRRPPPGNRAGLAVSETRIVAGRPAIVTYVPPGPAHHPHSSIDVWIYDPATGAQYLLLPSTKSLLGANVDALLAIAASLFEPPNPP